MSLNTGHSPDLKLSRAALPSKVIRVLNRGRWGNPDVLLVSTPKGPVVVKDFAPRRAWVRRAYGRRSIRREERAYRRLGGVAAVPQIVGKLDEEAIVIEYRPGVLLSRSLADSLPSGFFDELREAVAAMHARGIVHLDLRHRSNILAGDDGHPVLLDFATALRFDRSRRFARWMMSAFAWIDRRALEKWRVRLVRSGQSESVSAPETT